MGETEPTIEEYFARASNIHDDASCLFPDDLEELKVIEGAKKFKRMALGRFRKEAVKSRDEMMNLLYKTGISSSEYESGKILENIAGCRVKYSHSNALCIEQVNGREKEKDYHIYTYQCN